MGAQDAGRQGDEAVLGLIRGHEGGPHPLRGSVHLADEDPPEASVPMREGRPDMRALDSAKVVDLRAIARRIPGFPIKGRDVARAGRDELLAAFRSLNA